MTKFKVGDKVRILNASEIIGGLIHGLKDGVIYEVVELYNGRSWDPIIKLGNGRKFGFIGDDYKYIEKLPQTPTKNQRITTLESEVAELKAKVEALEKAQSPTSYKIGVDFVRTDADISKAASQLAKLIEGETDKRRKKMSLTPNEQRKAIIAEAKAFVEDAKNITGNCSGRKGYKYGSTNQIVCDVEFNVNAEKRTVVALLKYQYGGYVAVKGIAKCAPDDVFNADIGKAIALGRALGLDVSRFEQAVKPTEIVVGQRVEFRGSTVKIYAVRPEHRTHGVGKGGGFFNASNGFTYIDEDDFEYWAHINHLGAILDDTEAVY